MSDAMLSDYKQNGEYTYADYLEWEGPERYELINGEAFQMAAPSVAHQGILMALSAKFFNFLEGKPCRVYPAPLDVRLFPKEDNSDKTVVQPDVVVVCDKNKLGKGSVNGPPDLVVEIMSPSNSRKDLFLKFQYYLEAGVREYWVIDPEIKKVQVYIYENGRYFSDMYNENDRIEVSVLPGLEIALESLWNAAD